MVDRTDDFNRANGGLGANWTTLSDANLVGAINVSGNKAAPSTTGQDDAAMWSADTFQNDQYAQAVHTGTGQSGCGVICRASSGANKFYEWDGGLGGFSEALLLYDNTGGGNWTALFIGGGSASGDLLRLECTGTSIVGKINGTTTTTQTDATLASGRPGMHAYVDIAGTGFLDDWLGGPITAAAGDPFIPNDTSVEVQPSFPVSLRTWIGSNRNLLSPVTVTLPPGQASFERPQQRLPAGPTWTWQYNANLIGKDVLPPGRKGLVFDGPPKRAPPAGPTWTSRYNDNLIGKDVLPAGRRNPVFEEVQPILWRRGWELNLLQGTLAPSTAVMPFRQQDWPLPGRAPQPDRTWVSSAATLQLILPPPGEIWTDLPPAPLFWRNGSTLNLILSTLVGQDSFPPGAIRSDRPPPLDWRAGWTISLLQTTLAPSFAAPFAQYDWPLPRSYPQPDRTWVSFFNPNLVGQDAFPPGVVRSERALSVAWQNGFNLNLLLSTLAVSVELPRNQYHWPLPGQGWQPPRTWTSFYNINLIGKDQLPIRQMDWPLPIGYFYSASVRVAVPLNINLFPPPAPPVVTQEFRSVKVAGGEFGFMGLRGGVVG